MISDIVKEYIVCINNGSGVLFQPIDESYTYILTANHVITDQLKLDDNSTLIHFYDNEQQGYRKLPKIAILEGENYFPHDNALMDIAIVKIARLNTPSNLIFGSLVDKPETFYLVGFPQRRRSEPDVNAWISPDAIKRFLLSKPNGKREVEFDKHFTLEELKGHSGGGILKYEKGYIYLAGIESQIPIDGSDTSRVEFTPMEFFEEIVKLSNGKLENCSPYYLKSFKFLEDNIFRIKPGILEKDIADLLTKLLKAKAQEISLSDITPHYIKRFLKENLLLLSTQDPLELEKRRIWSTWLELLTILNIAKTKTHKEADLIDLFKTIRLFYSNIDEDFWLNHLDDLIRVDYTGLEKNGIVVVSTNCEAKGHMHVLDLSRIATDISRLKKEYELGRVGIQIDMGDNFPFENFKYINISAFKEDIIVNKHEKFKDLEISACLVCLKQLYEQLLTN